MYSQEKIKENIGDYLPDRIVITAKFINPDPQIIEVPICDEIPTAGTK